MKSGVRHLPPEPPQEPPRYSCTHLVSAASLKTSVSLWTQSVGYKTLILVIRRRHWVEERREPAGMCLWGSSHTPLPPTPPSVCHMDRGCSLNKVNFLHKLFSRCPCPFRLGEDRSQHTRSQPFLRCHHRLFQARNHLLGSPGLEPGRHLTAGERSCVPARGRGSLAQRTRVFLSTDPLGAQRAPSGRHRGHGAWGTLVTPSETCPAHSGAHDMSI